MKIRKLTTALALTALAFAANTTYAGPPATIGDLAWMTGNWAGNLGPNQLEENWIMGEGGSIAAMVRMTGAGATSMFEMITVEEVEGSLVLHIQQWDPGMVPRTESAQKMELAEIGENSVKFVAVSEGGMPTLGYSHPDAETFIIHVGQEGGGTFDINLSARSVWK
jgi:hypothetical protein